MWKGSGSQLGQISWLGYTTHCRLSTHLLKMSDSATRPPRAMHIRSISSSGEKSFRSEGVYWAKPSAWLVRGRIVTYRGQNVQNDRPEPCIAHPVGGVVLGKSQHLTRPRLDRHLGGKNVQIDRTEPCASGRRGCTGESPAPGSSAAGSSPRGQKCLKISNWNLLPSTGGFSLVCIWSICCSCRCT